MYDLEFSSLRYEQVLPFDQDIYGNDCQVYKQYKRGWKVRVLSDTNTIPHMKVGDSFIPLERLSGEQAFFNAPKEIEKTPLEGWAGKLELWGASNGKWRVLTPSLYVKPGSLSPEEFDDVIQRLRELALLQRSPYKSVSKHRTHGEHIQDQSRQDAGIDQSLLNAGEKLLSLASLIAPRWNLIEVNAARETQLIPQIMDITRHRGRASAQLALKADMRPDTRRMEVLAPQESHNTSENRFLVYVMAELCRTSGTLAGRLKSRSEQIRRDWKQVIPDRYARYRNAWNDGSLSDKGLAERFDKLAEDIEDISLKIKMLLSEPFLKALRNFPQLPSQPSNMLTQSDTYGPIYKAFYEYKAATNLLFVPLNRELEHALANKSIHPVNTLYELWVLIEFYDLLITRFGFNPSGGDTIDHPLSHITVENGEVIRHNLVGRPFQLTFNAANDADMAIHVKLWYDTEHLVPRCATLPRKRCYSETICQQLPCWEKIETLKHWNHLKPDLLVEVTVERSKKHPVTKKFAVDAKYRSYGALQHSSASADKKRFFRVEDVYDLDLLATAKMKYKDGLGCDAAFIVHSDPGDGYTFWGGRPWRTNPLREQLEKQSPHYPGHEFGSIFSSPRDISNLEKLLKCILMYHMEVTNICWNCRKQVTPKPDEIIKDNIYGIERRSVGNCYQCSGCNRFWVDTWCKGEGHHKILKLWNDTFHHPDPRQPGKNIYNCPRCPNQLPVKRMTIDGNPTFEPDDYYDSGWDQYPA